MKNFMRRYSPLIFNFLLSVRSRQQLRQTVALNKMLDINYRFPAREDPEHINAAVDWLLSLNELSCDGGIPRWVNLLTYKKHSEFNEPSFPETTGYILASLIFCNENFRRIVPKARLEVIKNYLLDIQDVSGGYFNVDPSPRLLAFDTGQILTGLCSYYNFVEREKSLAEAINKAANWMSNAISLDGSYKDYANFNGSRCYYAQATNGLFEAYKITSDASHLAAVKKNAEFIFSHFESPGWFDRFSFEDHSAQNLHGIAYTMRGMIDLGRNLDEEKYCIAVKKCGDEILEKKFSPNYFPGYLKKGYEKYSNFLCPTGMSQLAIVFYLLNEHFHCGRYKTFADELVEVCKGFQLSGFNDHLLDGGVVGSYPINGPYAHCSMPNWAAKFFLDALVIKAGAEAKKIIG